MFNATVGRLRGLSILAVICLHYAQYLALPFSLSIMGPAGNGYYGVTVFFVISGFLITTNVLKRGGSLATVSLPEFYIRRAARILPPLFLLLAFLVATSKSGIENLTVPDDMSVWKMLWYALTFRYNVFVHWYEGYRVAAWLILWSLAIEEMFYLWYPLLCKVLRLRFLILGTLAAMIIYGPIYRSTSLSLHFSPWDYFACFDAISMGAIVAILYDEVQKLLSPMRRLALMAAGLTGMLLTYLFVQMMFHYGIGPFLMGISASAALAASSFGDRKPTFDPLIFLGKHSYELYLFHISLIIIVRHFAPSAISAPLLSFSLYLASIVGFSYLMHKHFSEPMHDAILTLGKRMGIGRAISQSPN